MPNELSGQHPQVQAQSLPAHPEIRSCRL